MNFYEILKTKKLGRGSPDYWTQLFAEHVGGKGEWVVTELTGTLPMTFRSNGTALIDYRIYGTAEGAGVQTENLFDGTYQQALVNPIVKQYLTNPRCRTVVIMCNPNTTYTISIFGGCNRLIVAYSEVHPENRTILSNINNYYGTDIPQYVTVTTNADAHYMMCYVSDQNNTPTISIVKGFTPPSTYIPFGYKVPLAISSGTESKTADIYIGDTKLSAEEYVDYEEQKIYRWADITGLSEPLCGIDTYTDSLDLSTGTLTRRIKKLVLEGTIGDGNIKITTQGIIYITPIPTLRNIGIAYCTHYKNVDQSQGVSMPLNSFTTRGGAGTSLWFKTEYTTVADYKSYLAAQYAAGTPVTVWYVLDESEASTIPVPSGLTGTIKGYLIQDGTPTPETPIYPTANGVKQTDGTYSIEAAYLQPTDPPLPLPAIETFEGTNSLDSAETLGEVTIKGQIKPQS